MPCKVLMRCPEMDKLQSAIISFGPFSCMYERDSWTKAPEAALRQGYGLLCFGTLIHAQNFVDWLLRPPGFEIWQCKTRHRMPLPRLWFETPPELVTDFKPKLKARWPIGSIMAEKIKIVERAA